MTASLHLPDFRFTKTTMANGLDVIIRRQGALPIVAVNLWYHVGSKNEEPRQRGYAHLFEHLMFEGSEHYPGDYFKPLQQLGASINGSTSSDRTNYYEDLPAAHLETALAMESDRMACLIPALTDTKLRVQKDVVKNEYRQNYANRPYGMVSRLLAEALYPPNHPYSWITIGLMEEVEAATKDDVEAFFQRYYVPSNTSLCIVGDVDEEHALALAERYFGAIPGGAKALRPWTPEPTLDSDLELSLHDRVELTRDHLVWPTCPVFHPDDAPLTLLSDILARGKSSRLYRKLVVETEIAQNVSTHQSGRELAGSFSATVTLRPGKDAKAARAAIDSELGAIADQGPNEKELARVKNGRLAGFFYALENIGGFGGVADRLNAYNTFIGDPSRITSDFKRYQDVGLETIRNAAKRYLFGQKRIALTVSGQKPSKAVMPLDRSVRPAPRSPGSVRLPSPEIVKLSNGIPLWLVPSRDLPIIAGLIVRDGGAGNQRPGEAGLAELAASMLVEGTISRSSAEIAEEAESLGSSVSASAGWDGSYVSFQCLSPHLEATLDLTVDVLRNPTFPESEWSRIHGQTLTALRAERDRAESQTYREFLKRIFPEGHPYRLPIDGDEATVAGYHVEDALRFHRKHQRPNQSAIVVAGDFDPQIMARAFDERLGHWFDDADEPNLLDPQAINRPKAADRPRIVLIDRPGAPQATVRIGQIGLPRLDPAFENLSVLNLILGGQFSSRLNSKLREEKGFTYGIRSHFDFRKAAGPFSISASLQSDRLAEALVDIRNEVLELLGDRPPTESELENARRSLIEGQARHFETPASLVSRFASLYLYQLPINHHDQYAERLASVGIASMIKVGNEHLRPESFQIVVTASASQVAKSLEALDWADFEVIADN